MGNQSELMNKQKKKSKRYLKKKCRQYNSPELGRNSVITLNDNNPRGVPTIYPGGQVFFVKTSPPPLNYKDQNNLMIS